MSEYDEDVNISNGHYEVAVIIDCPVKEVWKRFLDMGSWVTSHHIETVKGLPRTLGEVTRVSFKNSREISLPEPHHHFCKIIKLIPEFQYVLKTFTGKDGAYGMNLTAFDDGRFFSIGSAQTKITWNVMVEWRSQAKATVSGDEQMEISRRGMLANLNQLKRILEGDVD